MREEYATTIKDLRGQIIDIKSEASETSKNIKSDLRNEVVSTKEYSENQLNRIETQTSQLAMDETKREVENIFQSDKIQNIIQNQAIQEIKNRVSNIVYNETKNISNINDAASEMRLGRPSGMRKLKSYFEHPTNVNDSIQARRLYDRITNDYNDVFEHPTNIPNAIQNVVNDTAYMRKVAHLVPIHIIDNHLPKDSIEMKELRNIMLNIDNANDDYDLNEVSESIYFLSKLANVHFKDFQIKEIDEWFKGLQKWK